MIVFHATVVTPILLSWCCCLCTRAVRLPSFGCAYRGDAHADVFDRAAAVIQILISSCHCSHSAARPVLLHSSTAVMLVLIIRATAVILMLFP